MAIKKLRIRNFKSFRDVEVELRDFNLLIGANASGKSNFVQVFQFLRDIESDGLENAISLQGGIKFLRNVKLNVSEDLKFDVYSDLNINTLVPTDIEIVNIEVYQTLHEFSLKFEISNGGYEVSTNSLTLYCQVKHLPGKSIDYNEELLNATYIGAGKIIIDNLSNQGVPLLVGFPEDLKLKLDHLKFSPIISYPLPMLTPVQIPFNFIPRTSFEFFSIYNFDPTQIKSVSPITGKADLDEDGENLAIVLRSILSNPDSKNKLMNIIRDTLPFIDDLKIKQMEDLSLMIQLKETYIEDYYFPSFLISDGTINVTALIIALYFEHKSSTVKPLTIIEEPDRGIHPHLISKVVHMMKDASSEKQIIASTHNPEMLKHADLDDVLLVSRDKDGFSTITRPSENEEIKTFLQNDLGIDDLYVQNLLEI